MKKNTLLIAVAAAALAVGSGTAFAQGPQKSESPAAQSPASKNAPAEKMEHKGANKAETTGQGASERGQKMGQDLDKTKKSTTGQAPSEPKSGQANERKNEKMGQEQKSPSNKSTTGQAPSQTTPNAQRSNEPNRMNSGQTNERTNERSGQTNERSGQTNERGTAETRGGNTNVSVNLTSEQRTKIHSIVVSEHNAPRVAHVDFDVRVGTVVPRGKVKFVTVPSTIVEIEPQWRGFEYFMVGDEIVIVDPATLRIVAVIPA